MPLLILAQRTAQFEVLNTVLIIIYKIWNAYDRLKPVMIVTVGGGPDENPWYTKTIECTNDYLLSQDLDAFFLATNAPGKSAFNRVERRLVKFSKELSGVVLPHDNFGSHLNAKGETIDKELEKKFLVCWGDTG